jgi:hypothetical protein
MPGLKNYAIVNYPQSYYLITSEYRYDNKLFFYDISGKLKFTYDLFEFGYKILFHPLKQSFLANHEIDYSNYYYTEYDINTKEITPHFGYNVMGYSHTGNSYGIFNEKEICAFWDGDSLPHSRIPYNSNLKEREKGFAISPEGKMIAARYEYNKIHIFNTITNREINTIDIIDYGKFGFIPYSSVLWMYSGFYLKFVNPLTGVKLDSIKISGYL